MRRINMITAAIAAASLLATVAAAQDWAKANLAKSSRHGEYVAINEPGGRQLNAWVVYPEVKDKAPVVVMIHEIYGMSDWAREMADELAGAGYIVVEPDLLSGFGPATATPVAAAPQQTDDHSHMQMPSNAGAAYGPAHPGGTSAFPDQSAVTRAVSALPNPQVMADLDAAADYGRKLPAANGKLFVAGFCWGGGKSFLFATHRHDLSGAFVFYGPPPPAELMKDINAPVYGFYAGNDARISATIPKTQDDMKAAGKTYEPVTYDGAGHGFMRAGEAPDANAANTAARQQGFHRFISLLGGVH
jgi:carboxymethylenebutenolidase